MSVLYPSPRQKDTYTIDPVAFFVALIGSPLGVTLVSCWLLVPVAALLIGGPVYLAIGAPLLLWHLSRNPADKEAITTLAIKTVIGLFGVSCGLIVLFAELEALFLAAFYFFCALIFGSIWANGFARIYLYLRRPFYAQAVALPQANNKGD